MSLSAIYTTLLPHKAYLFTIYPPFTIFCFNYDLENPIKSKLFEQRSKSISDAREGNCMNPRKDASNESM